jgi:hypothetical protein
MLIDNTRVPFTDDIAKVINLSGNSILSKKKDAGIIWDLLSLGL